MPPRPVMPRMQARPDAPADPSPRTVAEPSTRLTAPVRPVAQRPQRPFQEQPFEIYESERPALRELIAGRGLPLGIIAAAALVIVIGLVVIAGSGGSTPQPSGTANAAKTSTSQTGTAASRGVSKKHGKHHAVAPFSPASVTVAVLNGTAVAGLAGDVSKQLVAQGYKAGSVTNAASHSQSTTIVYFKSGFQAAAGHVATALKLGSSVVLPASTQALASCATTPTGASGTCSGQVIVSLGQDRANLASSTSTSAG